MRGLKLLIHPSICLVLLVALPVSAWIEMSITLILLFVVIIVALPVSAWIEILALFFNFLIDYKSHSP